MRKFEKKGYESADKLICVTPGLKRYLFNHYGIDRNKVKVIPNGVELVNLNNSHDEWDLRGEYHLETSPLLIFIGSFQPWHGVENLILSMKEIIRKIPQCSLALVGEGPMKEKIVAFIRENQLEKNVIMIGNISNNKIPSCIRSSDICLYYPAFDEVSRQYVFQIGLCPMKILEYMAGGKPIVSVEIPHLRDIIEENNCGLITKHDHVFYSNAVIKLIEDPETAKVMGKNGRIAIENKYNWSIISERIINFILN